MFIAVKNKKIIAIEEVEWMCRQKAKNLQLPEYWTWLESVTSEDEKGTKTYDFSGEDYKIVEVNDTRSYESKEIDDKGNPIVVLVWVDTLSYESKDEKGDTITIPFTQSGHIVSDLEGTHYHLTWDGSAILKDDTALTAYQTAEKWKDIRVDRNSRLAETDYLALSDQTLTAGMKTYRKKLRDVPKDNSDPDNITWPSKP